LDAGAERRKRLKRSSKSKAKRSYEHNYPQVRVAEDCDESTSFFGAEKVVNMRRRRRKKRAEDYRRLADSLPASFSSLTLLLFMLMLPLLCLAYWFVSRRSKRHEADNRYPISSKLGYCPDLVGDIV